MYIINNFACHSNKLKTVSRVCVICEGSNIMAIVAASCALLNLKFISGPASWATDKFQGGGGKRWTAQEVSYKPVSHPNVANAWKERVGPLLLIKHTRSSVDCFVHI